MKEKVTGKKKETIDANILIHPTTMVSILNKAEIPEIFADYIANILKHKGPKCEFVKDF